MFFTVLHLDFILFYPILIVTRQSTERLELESCDVCDVESEISTIGPVLRKGSGIVSGHIPTR